MSCRRTSRFLTDGTTSPCSDIKLSGIVVHKGIRTQHRLQTTTDVLNKNVVFVISAPDQIDSKHTFRNIWTQRLLCVLFN